MNRSEVREATFFLVFESMFSDSSVEEILQSAYDAFVYEITDDVEEFFGDVYKKADELDEIISKYSEKRQLGRIPKVSIAILHIAIYEILYSDRVPTNVAISEAVLLSKKFSYESDTQFVNGVLSAFSKNIEDKGEKTALENIDE